MSTGEVVMRALSVGSPSDLAFASVRTAALVLSSGVSKPSIRCVSAANLSPSWVTVTPNEPKALPDAAAASAQ